MPSISVGFKGLTDRNSSNSMSRGRADVFLTSHRHLLDSEAQEDVKILHVTLPVLAFLST